MKIKRYSFLPLVPVALTLGLVGCKARGPQEVDVSLPKAALRDPKLSTVSLNLPENFTAPPSLPGAGGKMTESADQRKTALVAANLMTRSHYLHHPLDAELSGKIFTEYIDSLDPRHLYFLASDMQEFETYRNSLGDQLMKGDVTPAYKIYARLMQRIDQQNAYVTQQLKTEKFSFDSNDTFPLDRKTAPHPANIEEAKQQWNEFLRYEYLQEKLNKQKPEEIVKTLTRRYARQSKTLRDYDSDDVFEIYLNALAHACDPHSDYLGKSALDNFNIQMKLSVIGIGATLSPEDGYAKIVELAAGGPAFKSGKLKVGDRITAVAQDGKEVVDTVDMKLDKVVSMIRGPKGTKVRLTYIPADAPDPSTRKTIELTRDEVKLDEQEAKAKIIDTNVNGKAVRLGVIDLPSFYADFSARNTNGKSTTADVARLLKKLEAEKVSGIILDLRRNPGGSLQEVINLTGLFIKPGPVVQVKDSDGDIQVDKSDAGSITYDGPMIVLTSKLSASASEIMAGALQDYGRALIVGDSSTFGKGTVQTVAGLSDIMKRSGMSFSADPGALKLTIQKFYRASGASTQLKGVVPDIELPSLTNYIDYGEKTLDNPLKYDVIKAATFQPEDRFTDILPELKKRSSARIATDKDFLYLSEEIDQFKKLMKEKTVSLNEAVRLKEKQEAEERVKARRKELLVRPASKDKVYLVTLENLSKPTLTLAPPPKSADKTAKPNSQNPIPTDDAAGNDATAPAVDTTLTESERILEDILELSAGKAGKTVARSGQ